MKMLISARILFALIILPVLAQSATSPGRSYQFGFEKGNLIRNWSFEEKVDNWFDESYSGCGVKARYLAKSSNITAVSGSYVGQFTGTNTTGAAIAAFQSDVFPVQSATTYVITMYVYSVSNTANLKPTVEFFSSNSLVPVGAPIDGGSYFQNTNAWVPYNMSVTTPAGALFARIKLAKVNNGEGGTLYFDDLMMEKGSVALARDHVGESITFFDDAGQPLQTQSKIAGGGNSSSSRQYLVQSSTFDVHHYPFKSYMPYLNSGAPNFDNGFDSKAKAYYGVDYNNGNGVGSLGSNPFSQTNYAEEPGGRLLQAYQSGDLWATNAKSSANGSAFVNDLNPPAVGSEESPTVVSNGVYLYSWSRDVEKHYSLAWTNAEGEMIQQAANLSGRWIFSRYEYYPNGKVKKALTNLDSPTDDLNQPYRQVTNYNSMGEVTSTYTGDKGLQKFYYNRLGQPRFSQPDVGLYNLFHYTDYDIQDRPISMGEQQFTTFDPIYAEDRATSTGTKTEHAGIIYEDLTTFSSRLGFPVTDILPSDAVVGNNAGGRIVCEYARNNEVGYMPTNVYRNLVAIFYSYNTYGQVTDAYKYIGQPASLAQRVHHAVYSYDQTHRIVDVQLYVNTIMAPQLISEKAITYDALGRISKLAGLGGKFLSGYAYYDWGGLKSVTLGGDGSISQGTRIDYKYHGHGWVKEIDAVQQSTNAIVFQQFLGYEGSIYPGASITNPNPKYNGAISQQLLKFATDILPKPPVRLTNYGYDDLGRLVNSDMKVNGNANPLDGNQKIVDASLSFLDTQDMDSHTQIDDVGRIVNAQNGVSPVDAASYNYRTNSFELDNINGKLGPNNSRNASAPSTFVYDSQGRMTEDHSKNMAIHYGWNEMPTEIILAGSDGTQTTIFNYYDASGYRVGQARLKYNQFNNNNGAIVFVGNQETGDPAGMYSYNTLISAYNGYAYKAAYGQLDPSISQITFYYILDRGNTTTTQQGETNLSLFPLTRSNGPTLSIKIVGIIKGSRSYFDLLQGYFTGTMLSATEDVALLGPGDRRNEETWTNGIVSSTKSTTGIFGASGAVIGRINSTNAYEYYVKNHQGSIMKVVNEDGTFLSSANSTTDYMPYGDPLSIKQGTDKVSQGYTGKEHDDDLTRLTYFGARFYDPEIGMWMSPDPAKQFFNPYSYNGGEVVNATDPDGRYTHCEGGGVVPTVCYEMPDLFPSSGLGGGAGPDATATGARALMDYGQKQYQQIMENADITNRKIMDALMLSIIKPIDVRSKMIPILSAVAQLEADSKARLASIEGSNEYFNSIYQHASIASASFPQLTISGSQEVPNFSDYREPFTGNYKGVNYVNDKALSGVGLENADGTFFGFVGAGVGALGKLGEAAEEGLSLSRVGEYTYTETVSNHAMDIVKKGEYAGQLSRPYMNSPSTINEIISTGKGLPDPGGLSNALRYDVPGTFRGSEGTWQLVVDPSSNTIYHFNFVGY